MERAPLVPEFTALGPGIQEAGNLMRVERDGVAAQYVPQEVQRGIRQRVGEAQDVEIHIRHAQPAAAPPELFGSRRRQPLHGIVPKPEVQFDGQRDIDIEKVAAPFPAGPADQRGQMIGGEVLHPRDPLVAQVA